MAALFVQRTLQRRLYIGVALALAGLASHATHAGSGDVPHYLAIAHSIAFDFDLDLSNNYGADEPLIDGGGLQPERHAVPVDGRLRPVHDVGLPLLFAPYVRLAAPASSWIAARLPASVMRRLRLTPTIVYRQAMTVPMICLAATLAVVLFDVFVCVGLPGRTAFWTALLISLSPPLLIFGLLFFTELLSALLCLAIFRRVVLDDRPGRALGWVVAGAGTGLLMLIHARNIGFVFALSALAVARLARRDRLRGLSAFGAGLVALLAVRTAFNHHLWGTWVASPLAHGAPWPGAGETVWTVCHRLLALTFDQEFGLLPYAPVFVLAAAGLVTLARTNRRVALGIAIVAGTYLATIVLPFTNPYGWTGGWAPAARFLTPVVPLLAIGVGVAMRATPRAILVPILVLQIGIDMYMWQHPKNLWNDGDGVAAACARTGATFCRYLPSFSAFP